jgi:hypothetical protein
MLHLVTVTYGYCTKEQILSLNDCIISIYNSKRTTMQMLYDYSLYPVFRIRELFYKTLTTTLVGFWAFGTTTLRMPFFKLA